jgi:hypothetical protein
VSAGSGRGGRPSGLPKTGGRQKGTPNRATSELKQKLAALGCDPAEELVKIAQNHKTPDESKIQIYSTLLPYVYPKRKPMEDSNDESLVINVNTSLDNEGGSTDVRDQYQPDAQATPSSGV